MGDPLLCINYQRRPLIQPFQSANWKEDKVFRKQSRELLSKAPCDSTTYSCPVKMVSQELKEVWLPKIAVLCSAKLRQLHSARKSLVRKSAQSSFGESYPDFLERSVC